MKFSLPTPSMQCCTTVPVGNNTHPNFEWRRGGVDCFFFHWGYPIGGQCLKKTVSQYRKIPKISPGAYTFQRPFLRGLFSEGPIFGGAYVRREICVSKAIGLACSGKQIYHFCFVLLRIQGQIPSTSPPGGLYSEGRFNGGFFALRFWGAYLWRGLYMEGLIFGILRYLLCRTDKFHPWCSALYFLLRSLLCLACLFVYFNGPPSRSLIFFNKQKYLLFREQISANDSSPVTILEAATGPGIRSRRSMSVAQQSTKTQICNTT